MLGGAGGFLTALGFLVLTHTTLGVIKHRELLKILQEEFDTLPTVLLGELILGTVLAGLGAFLLAGHLKPVVLTRQAGSTDQGGLRLDFVSFNSRAKAFNFDIPTRK